MSRKPETVQNPSTYITQIRSGCMISGNMKSEHSIRVDGHVTGDLISVERIIIGAHGEIGGNLSGADITIEGYVNGDVLSNGHLHIAQAGRVYGKIFAKQISVENGAEMNGKVTVGKEVEIPEVNTSSPSRSTKDVTFAKKTGSGDQKDNYGTVAW
ncbi:MAG: polymer-forming cytoskeletal protein [Cytophagia bacterium]|nr:polymer-forming cytoskeletal protein [Cytophagia bacterium]